MKIKDIGFIGLGIMGQPMAMRLLAAGYRLNIYARRVAATELLKQLGATVYATPQALAEVSPVIITMVSDTPDVEQVHLGDDGVVQGAKPGAVAIDMTTASPTVTRDIAQKLHQQGIDMLDAPVSGGDIGARDGTLSIMIGGDRKVFEKVLPVFKVLGENIIHVGDHGAGQVAKACNQMLVAQTIAATAEVLIFAKAMAVDPVAVRKALLGGFAGSRVLDIHGQRMLDGDHEPGFKLGLHAKDMRIVSEQLNELGITLNGTKLASKRIAEAVEYGDGELDTTVILRHILKHSGHVGDTEG